MSEKRNPRAVSLTERQNNYDQHDDHMVACIAIGMTHDQWSLPVHVDPETQDYL